MGQELKKSIPKKQNIFKKGSNETDAAVKASYVESEIAKAGKLFKEGEFVNKCMLQAADKVCPEKKGVNSVTLAFQLTQ